jgi:hypothetical protein
MRSLLKAARRKRPSCWYEGSKLRPSNHCLFFFLIFIFRGVAQSSFKTLYKHQFSFKLGGFYSYGSGPMKPQKKNIHFFGGLLGETVSASQLTTRRSRFSEESVMKTFLKFKAKGF